MKNPFRRKPRTRWERFTDSLPAGDAGETTKRGMLAVGALVAASAASAVVTAVRESQDGQ